MIDEEIASRDLGFGLEEEALRVYKLIPDDWIAAQVNGKATTARVTLSFMFRLSHLPPPE